jgi:hypothetical protein
LLRRYRLAVLENRVGFRVVSAQRLGVDQDEVRLAAGLDGANGFCDAPELGGDTLLDSSGYNIESPEDTCGFDQVSDQAGVTGVQLNLGPLQDNGGPTETRELRENSVAIDQIPAAECVDGDGEPLRTDQRGETRPAGAGSECDVGAFEVQP